MAAKEDLKAMRRGRVSSHYHALPRAEEIQHPANESGATTIPSRLSPGGLPIPCRLSHGLDNAFSTFYQMISIEEPTKATFWFKLASVSEAQEPKPVNELIKQDDSRNVPSTNSIDLETSLVMFFLLSACRSSRMSTILMRTTCFDLVKFD